MIKWQESYSTGVAKLDEQHKSLFKYSNELEESLNSQGVSKETLQRSLHFLERYVKGHFGQEESCMHQFACPAANINKLAHQKFIEAYITFSDRISKDADNDVDSDAPLKELHHFLENWLTEHICKIDTQLKPCVHPS